MRTPDYENEVKRILGSAGVAVLRIEERTFPGERWLIIYVQEQYITLAQSLAGSIEESLNIDAGDRPFAVTFRPERQTPTDVATAETGGRLASGSVTRLIQLLEARSRASDALPSLKYIEDPRASLAAVAASRHQLVYGRRGVGKTALLLEAKRQAETEGHVAVWVNAHTLRHLDAASAFFVIAETAISAIIQHAGSTTAKAVSNLKDELPKLATFDEGKVASNVQVGKAVASLNQALRGILRQGIVRLYVFLDDYYLIPKDAQPVLLDHVAGMLRDCDGWLKVASIERLTRPYEPSSRMGLEIPHDASKIDIDVTLEDPEAAQKFLESVLSNYTAAAGIRRPSSVAKPEALGRLVLASGGVPRDYLNLFASSIVVARQSRPQAREIGREDVAKAAGLAARGKKRDLGDDVSSEESGVLLAALEELSTVVQNYGYTYFRIDMIEKSRPAYDLLGQLVDMRFMHLVLGSLSDQHKAGKKYEAYILDLSEYTDVRLKRSLTVLDLENGHWTTRLTGKAKTTQRLTGTQLRDQLRQGPLIHVDSLLTPTNGVDDS